MSLCPTKIGDKPGVLHFEKEGKALFWRGFSISWGKFIPSHLGKCPRVRDRLRDEETRGGAGFGGCGPRPRLAAWRARKPASPPFRQQPRPWKWGQSKAASAQRGLCYRDHRRIWCTSTMSNEMISVSLKSLCKFTLTLCRKEMCWQILRVRAIVRSICLIDNF